MRGPFPRWTAQAAATDHLWAGRSHLLLPSGREVDGRYLCGARPGQGSSAAQSRRCYAVSRVRLVTSLTNLLVVLAVGAGVPQWYALEAGMWAPASARDSISVDALTPDAGPAEARASRDGGRSRLVTAWKSVQPHPAVLPTGVVVPSPRLSTPLARAVFPFLSSAATSSHVIRGPPVDL